MVRHPTGDIDLHDLADEQFLEEVHSFQFWFDSVEGYLSDRAYGRSRDEAEPELAPERVDRLITTLCNYCVGETAALDGSSSLVRLAPSRNAKIFMATQVVDEARHLEVFLHRLADLGVVDAEREIDRRANPALLDFRGELLHLVDAGDWPAAVFAQNVVLETLEYTVFQFHAANTDTLTSEVLTGVISDERRHSGFGENHLGRWLVDHPNGRGHLRDVRARLDPLVVAVFEGALTDIGVPRSERPPLATDYIDAIDRLGLT
jgi:hypothetical protein